MPRQTFENHVRYYAAHHFVFYPLLLVSHHRFPYMHSNDFRNKNISGWQFHTPVFYRMGVLYACVSIMPWEIKTAS